jgi:hypothetical protein
MVVSFHHMKPELAKNILKDAQDNKVPICIYEIRDNGAPTFFWWLSIPIIFVMALIITRFVKPLT